MKRLAVAILLLAVAVWLAGMGIAQEDRPRRDVNVTVEDEGCPQGPDRFCVRPAEVELEEGTDLVLNVANAGRVNHNLTFDPDTPGPLAERGMERALEPNETRRIRLSWDVIEESLEEAGTDTVRMHCGLPGHAALGERFTIHVPALASGEEQPQPGPGVWAVLSVLAVAAYLGRSRKDG